MTDPIDSDFIEVVQLSRHGGPEVLDLSGGRCHNQCCMRGVGTAVLQLAQADGILALGRVSSDEKYADGQDSLILAYELCGRPTGQLVEGKNKLIDLCFGSKHRRSHPYAGTGRQAIAVDREDL